MDAINWPLAKRSTLAIEPALELAVTVTVCGTLTATVVLSAGLDTATVGAAAPTTVTIDGAELERLPELSVATAVNVYMPAALGVKETLKGNAAAPPILMPLAKKSTLTRSPLPSAVDADTVIGLPTE